MIQLLDVTTGPAAPLAGARQSNRVSAAASAAEAPKLIRFDSDFLHTAIGRFALALSGGKSHRDEAPTYSTAVFPSHGFPKLGIIAITRRE
jgi:hypothetical protein